LPCWAWELQACVEKVIAPGCGAHLAQDGLDEKEMKPGIEEALFFAVF